MSLNLPGDRAAGMYRADTQQTEREGVNDVERIVLRELKWLFRDQPVLDYGIDAHVELVGTDDRVSGRLIGLQIKAGTSKFASRNQTGWVFRDSSKHLSYWLGHTLPVVVVIVDPEGNAYWEAVTTETVHETREGFRIQIRSDRPLNASAADRLVAVAVASRLTSSMAAMCDVLPTETCRLIAAAEQIDSVGALRLADALSGGRFSPGMTAQSLIAARPTWLSRSAAVEDLWLAVGSYASEHARPREAANAFVIAARSGGTRSARATAFAGLSLLFVDRLSAEPLLVRAFDGGAELLAAVGLAGLEAPIGDARVLETPAAIADASDAQLDKEPVVLNFLAEMEIRRGNLGAAVTTLRRALRASDSSAMHLALAHALFRRSNFDGQRVASDWREALGEAGEAVRDRRRWCGPSVEALSLYLDILVMTDDHADVIPAAKGQSLGGTATPDEAADPEIARRGALASLICGSHAEFEYFVALLPEGAALEELRALRADLDHPDRPTSAEEWRDVLALAAEDDQLAARCVSRLAHLGHWAPQADELRERSVLPIEVFETLRAVHQVEVGAVDVGLGALASLADRFPLAAFEFVAALRRRGRMEDAADHAAKLLDRWTDPLIIRQLLGVLCETGRTTDAARFAERFLENTSLGSSERADIAQWLASSRLAEADSVGAIGVLRRALAIDDDPSLAWSLLFTLVNGGQISEARQELERRGLEPSRDQEVRLWIQLHLGRRLPQPSATLLVKLARRETDERLRSVMIDLLIRDVLLQDDNAFSSATRTAVSEFAAQAGFDGDRLLEQVPNNDESISAALRARTIDTASFDLAVRALRAGSVSSAELAETVGQPYGAVLLQRPAGILYAFDLSPAIRRAGETAAERSLQSKAAVVDLSAIHTLSLFHADDYYAIRSRFSELATPAETAFDCMRTRERMQMLSVASHLASLRSDGSVERVELSPRVKALLVERAESLERLCSQSAMVVTDNRRLSVASISLAQTQNRQLWCDDAAMRQRARAVEVQCFSTLDLLTVLEPLGLLDSAAAFVRLVDNYSLDLPANADMLIAALAYSGNELGPLLAATSRREWWQYQPNADEAWNALIDEVAKVEGSRIADLVTAGVTGAVQAVSSGLATRRYQTLLASSLATAASHGLSDDSLVTIIESRFPSQLVASRRFVRAAVESALVAHKVADSATLAKVLVPDL
jgi:tetratricopeptide (TPR) repeat protein